MKRIWVSYAWLREDAHHRWQRDVMFTIDSRGHWSAIEANVPRKRATELGADCFDDAALSPLVNAHSHAFQRAFVAFAERRESGEDDFWSWRDRMYRVALAIDPAALKAIAKHLYLECLRGGYSHVCEFHYLHRDHNGSHYADQYETSRALIDAAREVGMGITLLPVVYEYAGFGQQPLRDDQRRFHANVDWVLTAESALADGYRSDSSMVRTGVALHSLRAVSTASLQSALSHASGPLHIHVAEQRAEVDACVAHYRARPIEYLTEQLRVRSHQFKRVHVVHGTQSTKQEMHALAQVNGALIICPTTEANLGDGLTDVSAWLREGVQMTIGSDAHVTRDWREELRLLEYGQRLQRRARSVLAAPDYGFNSTAERLYAEALRSSACAAGMAQFGFEVGARADMSLLGMNEPEFAGVSIERLLDAIVFSSPMPRIKSTMTLGQWRNLDLNQTAPDFSRAVASLPV